MTFSTTTRHAATVCLGKARPLVLDVLEEELVQAQIADVLGNRQGDAVQYQSLQPRLSAPLCARANRSFRAS